MDQLTRENGLRTSIKESSDELNPSVVVEESVPRKNPRSLQDYVALAIATCGVGNLPLAPGTWGSLVGIAIYLLVRGALLKLFFDAASPNVNTFDQVQYAVVAFGLLAIVVIVAAGVWAASQTEKFSGKKDPGKVVIDEVAGQYIALLPIPLSLEPAWWSMILAFILFRFFDIVKPYPARRLESLHGGLGIMADDIIAGIYAAIIVAIVISLRWFI
jgi:phosphatidylglycerophosphatase A